MSAWTSTDLENLEKAMATGALTVEYSDKKITYRSLEDMMKVRDLMRNDLQLTDGRFGRILSEHNKGAD